MFAIVKSGVIESTGTLDQIFPNTSFPGGVAPDDFKIAEGVKSERTTRAKEQANEQLALTDWMVIRLAERETAIPSDTVTYRVAVVAECARLEAAIAGAADVDALQAVMQAQNWPEQD